MEPTKPNAQAAVNSASVSSPAPVADTARANGANGAADGTTGGAGAGTPALPRELEQREPGPDRRGSVVDRRVGVDRRQASRDDSGYTGPERRVARADRRETSGLERRRGPGRRRSDDRKAAEEGEMTNEQFEFCMAIETYKKVNKKMYPTWTEVLEVIRHLGYRKVQPRDIKLENCPEPELYKLGDRRENADAA